MREPHVRGQAALYDVTRISLSDPYPYSQGVVRVVDWLTPVAVVAQPPGLQALQQETRRHQSGDSSRGTAGSDVRLSWRRVEDGCARGGAMDVSEVLTACMIEYIGYRNRL
jgi:hypothetical protein